MNNPKILVIVLNYRTPEMSLRAVKAALADMPKGAELVLVDNASGDGSAAMFEQEIATQGWAAGNRVRLILSQVNGGFGAGNNLGFAANMSDGSRPDYYYVLNSDAFPDTGCIAALTDFLEATPKAGFAGSHVRGEDDVTHETAFRFPSIASEFEGAARLGIVSKLLRHARVAPPVPTQVEQVDWVSGASVMMRADALDEIGHFDETFFLYFEETDLFKRGARAGWQAWYLPHARVVHIGSVSTGVKDVQRMPSYWFASRSYYFNKNHGMPYAAVALIAHLLGGLIYRLRCAIGARAVVDPAHFLTDLLRHGLGLSLAQDTPATPRSVTEEQT